MNSGGAIAYLLAFTAAYRAELEWYWLLAIGIVSIPVGSFLWDLVRGKRPQDDIGLWIKGKWKRAKIASRKSPEEGPNNPISMDDLAKKILHTMRESNKK